MAFQLPPQLSLLGRRAGQRLPEAVRAKMESALRADLSDVRIHVGPEAGSLGALAFTHGSNIYFAPGQYNPQTFHGQALLGHELAHVLQQRAGRVTNPFSSGVAVVQDHGLEAEADRIGHRAAAHRVEVAQAKQAAVRISGPMHAGPKSYRISAGTGGREIGSVVMHNTGKTSVEVTDLGVQAAHRQHGIGQRLMASAARAALRLGKSKVALAAEDSGSRRLTEWYTRMGFAQVGVTRGGFPRLEAPIARLLASVAQPHMSGTIQRKKGKKGGKSGLGYGSLAAHYDEEDIAEAMDRAGLEGVKGHGKGHSGSGQSGQTTNETQLVVEKLHEIRDEKKAASRPKAVIKNRGAMSNYAKALQKAKELKGNGGGLGDFYEYLENRQITDLDDDDITEILAESGLQ